LHPVGVFTIGVSANQPDFRLFEDLPLAARNTARPLSPHLQIWKWGPNMLVSILHRATGTGMATVGARFVWFLAAVAAGRKAMRPSATSSPSSRAAEHHRLCRRHRPDRLPVPAHGQRHPPPVHGCRRGFELKSNKRQAQATIVFAVVMTVAFWLYLGIK
jgi:succinate dehydrogenase / fumarate reductase cytochrome b subunit